jgi:hypothetical protein
LWVAAILPPLPKGINNMTKNTTELVAPKTPDEMADVAADIAAASATITAPLIRYGLGLANDIIDAKGARRQMIKADVAADERTAGQYLSIAKAMAAAYGLSAAFRKDGPKLGRSKAYTWAQAITKAAKDGGKLPTAAQAAKDAKDAERARKAAKADADKAKGGDATPKAEPTTWADALDIVAPVIDAAALRSGDAAAFYRNMAKWAAGQADARSAAKAIAAKHAKA